jgi:hypothetical protein
MKKTFAWMVMLVSLLMAGCETDFDTTGDWEDITVVYGLIDHSQPVQYVKINKAFLGKGNALVMAQEPDSVSYGNSLNVRIEEWDDDVLVQTILLDTTTVYDKEPGVFYAPEQVVYKTRPYNLYGYDTVTGQYTWLNPDDTYKLVIENTKSGKTVTSHTGLVRDFSISKPNYGSTTINFKNMPNLYYTLEWDVADNGAIYEILIEFTYRELAYNSTDTVTKTLVLSKGESIPTTFQDEITYPYLTSSFYGTILAQVPYDDPAVEANIKERYSENVIFTISVATKELQMYIETNKPSTSVVQEKPQYTNIDDGLGIFASRYSKSRAKRLHAESVDELKTLNIKFIY